ncbi:seryl-tRNA synthetase [Ramicandelaber brevisporus]|nr:seryl-tRNA synthetase [Ramicandelaber brevisporus]
MISTVRLLTARSSRHSTLLQRVPTSVRCHSTGALPKPTLDFAHIRANAKAIDENICIRKARTAGEDANEVGPAQRVAAMYSRVVELRQSLDQLRAQRKQLGKQIRGSDSDSQAAKAAAKEIKDQFQQQEAELKKLEHEMQHLALTIPNSTHPSVPIGDESKAVVVSTYPANFTPTTTATTTATAATATATAGADGLATKIVDHVAIAKELDLVDFETASAASGNSFYYLKRELALMEMALIQFAMSKALKRGFVPVSPPDVVRVNLAESCGFRPRDSEAGQTYYVSSHHSQQQQQQNQPQQQHQQHELCLSATAEIPLAGLLANAITPERKLPLKYVAFGRAFRAEAGARGSDTRGLYRVHQFSKVELFVATTPTQSDEMLEEIRELQQEILQDLGIPFRVLNMPSEELGASAVKKYDMEAWMPGRKSGADELSKWGEVSSASNCTDYQARRLGIKYITQTVGEPNQFVHTLNGTACAVPRILIAILENFAQLNPETGSLEVAIPRVLHPWMMGITKITRSQSS